MAIFLRSVRFWPSGLVQAAKAGDPTSSLSGAETEARRRGPLLCLPDLAPRDGDEEERRPESAETTERAPEKREEDRKADERTEERNQSTTCGEGEKGARCQHVLPFLVHTKLRR